MNGKKEFRCRIENLSKYLVKSGVPLLTILRAKTGNIFVFEGCKLEEYEKNRERSLF